MPLDRRVLNRATLDRQMLLARERIPVVDAVRRVVALQAQEPASPYLALWNRIDGFDPADLDAAFAAGTVVKATLIRIALHAVHAGDYTAFHQAMLGNLRASRLNDRRFTDTGVPRAEVDALEPRLVEFASRPRTVPEIEAWLGEHLGASHPRVWWALKTYGPLVHVPTGATWSFDGRRQFRAAPTEPARTDPGRALQRLLWRYLEGFGPASAKDFGQFALQRLPPIKAALAGLAGELVISAGPGGEVLYDVPGARLPDGDIAAPPRLLGMWDNILLAYSDRSRVLPEEYRRLVIRRNGDVLPAVLVDGHVCGVWHPAAGGIEVQAFRPLAESAWDGLAVEAAALSVFLAGRDPDVYRRYEKGWTGLPSAETRMLGG